LNRTYRIEQELGNNLQITEIKESEKDHSKRKNVFKELKEEFVDRKDKIMELAIDPCNLKIKIEDDKLFINEDLICLFCTDRDILYQNTYKQIIKRKK